MNYLDFRNTFAPYPAFSIRQIETAFPGFDRKILVSWQRKGHIHKIRNSWYCFADTKRSVEDLLHIANRIYTPSYVSLEFALAHYQLIPEGVFSITSVTSLKTNVFHTPLGVFLYKHIKPALLHGYKLVQFREYWYKIADPEKAILDFLYLNPQYKTPEDLESLRIPSTAWEDTIDLKKLLAYAQRMQSKALIERMHKLMDTVNA